MLLRQCRLLKPLKLALYQTAHQWCQVSVDAPTSGFVSSRLVVVVSAMRYS